MEKRKRKRGRSHGARFTKSKTVQFTPSQMSTLEALAERGNVSVASLVRDAVDASIPLLRQRIRRKQEGGAG